MIQDVPNIIADGGVIGRRSPKEGRQWVSRRRWASRREWPQRSRRRRPLWCRQASPAHSTDPAIPESVSAQGHLCRHGRAESATTTVTRAFDREVFDQLASSTATSSYLDTDTTISIRSTCCSARPRPGQRCRQRCRHFSTDLQTLAQLTAPPRRSRWWSATVHCRRRSTRSLGGVGSLRRRLDLRGSIRSIA